MKLNKYIIKNCPALYGIDDGFLCSDNNDEDEKYCIDCTDCVIKQVIKKCKYYQNKIGRTPQHRAGFVDATSDILQLFDIEEIRE